MSNKPNALLLKALALVLCFSVQVVTTLSLGNLDLALPDVQRCLSPILGVPGCLNELIDADLRLEPRLLGPPCCNAFLQINQYCWAKLFPMDPGFAPSLKDYCLGLPPPQPPPNTPGAPPVPVLTPPPSIPQTPPPQSPHKPSPPQIPHEPPLPTSPSPSKWPSHSPPPSIPYKPSPLSSPRKPPSSSPNTLPPQSPHKPPPLSSPSKPPSHSPTPRSSDTPPAESPHKLPSHTPPSASPQKTPPLICISDVDMDDLSEEWDGDFGIN